MYDFILDENLERAYFRKFQNNDEKTVKLVGNINSKHKENVCIKIMKDNNYPLMLNVKSGKKEDVEFFSILKSNLQKQVRRKNLSSVSTAFIMMEMDMFELLRRLSVIAFEDSEISKETSVIVWLMCAVSKGFIVTDRWKEFILQYVKCITINNTCFRLEYTLDHTIDGTDENLSVSQVFNQVIKDGKDSKDEGDKDGDNKYLAGILFRNSFGGLHGDVLMISSIIDYMIKNNVPLKSFPIADTKSLKILSFLKKNPQLDIHEAALDFHTYPKIIEKIYNIYPHISKEDIKSSIWLCSSGINHRKERDIPLYYKEIWDTISEAFHNYGKEYLRRFL